MQNLNIIFNEGTTIKLCSLTMVYRINEIPPRILPFQNFLLTTVAYPSPIRALLKIEICDYIPVFGRPWTLFVSRETILLSPNGTRGLIPKRRLNANYIIIYYITLHIVFYRKKNNQSIPFFFPPTEHNINGLLTRCCGVVKK